MVACELVAGRPVRARRAEHRDRGPHRSQGVEPFDELGQDPQRPPWVRIEERRGPARLEKLFVLGPAIARCGAMRSSGRAALGPAYDRLRRGSRRRDRWSSAMVARMPPGVGPLVMRAARGGHRRGPRRDCRRRLDRPGARDTARFELHGRRRALGGGRYRPARRGRRPWRHVDRAAAASSLTHAVHSVSSRADRHGRLRERTRGSRSSRLSARSRSTIEASSIVQVREAAVSKRLRCRIEQRGRPVSFDEPAKLAGGDRAFPQVDEGERETTLLEEAHRGPRVVVVVETEHLDRGCDGGGHERSLARRAGTIGRTGGAR